MRKSVSQEVQFAEGSGAIHGFSTGMVSVKSKFKTAKGGQLLSKINFLLDKQWTAFMPIWVWVIDHPEGVFVVDTGENAKVNEEGYFKQEGAVLNYINTKSFRFDVRQEDEVGPQLKRLGYQQKDIRKVILTHLHLDHFDGLSYFDSTEIIVNKLEWEHPSFALPSLYPEWFEPQTVKLQEAEKAIFTKYHSLTESKEIALVHTPGHTKGHCSVLLKTNEMDYLFAGDVTYDQHQLKQGINAGGHQSFMLSKNTFVNIKRYARKNKLVYLPSHDKDSSIRIMKNEYLKI